MLQLRVLLDQLVVRELLRCFLAALRSLDFFLTPYHLPFLHRLREPSQTLSSTTLGTLGCYNSFCAIIEIDLLIQVNSPKDMSDFVGREESFFKIVYVHC